MNVGIYSNNRPWQYIAEKSGPDEEIACGSSPASEASRENLGYLDEKLSQNKHQ